MAAAQSRDKLSKYNSPHPVLGPNDTIGSGDTRIVYDVFTDMDTEGFTTLKNEIKWQKMFHVSGEVPRLVCVQGQVEDDGTTPIYRHPSDHSLPLLPFSSSVETIRKRVETIVGHPMNHVLIQLYRGGEDYISEHSDKTLDIVRGSSIVNVSLGAQRTMRLKTKKSAGEVTRRTQLIPMPHGSVFVLGLKTNEEWLHGINADKRQPTERAAEEAAFDGQRISFTFRNIGTFLTSDESFIWGQGACSKSRSTAGRVVNGNEELNASMIKAFGIENQQSAFDWNAQYGNGFDILHFSLPRVLQEEETVLYEVEEHDL